MSFASRFVPLALALVLAASPAAAARRAFVLPPPPPGASPIKVAQQRRMMMEPMREIEEHRERAERVRELRRLAKKLRASGKATLHVRGESAQPIEDETLTGQDAPLGRAPSREALTSQRASIAALANVRVNDPSGDTPLPSFGNVAVEGQCETAIARWGPYMVAAWNDGQGYADGSYQTQGWATSTDGGLTWTDRGAMPAPSGWATWKWTSDPVLAVNPTTGAFYFAALGDDNYPGVRNGVGVAKGRFNGSSFAWSTISVPRTVTYGTYEMLDKEWIAVDPADGRVYLTYTYFYTYDEIDAQAADSSLSAWSAVTKLSTASENGWVQGSRPAVGPDGTVWVTYYAIGPIDVDYLRVVKSTDRGATFTTPANAASFYANSGSGAPGFNRWIGVQFPSIAVDRSGGAHDGRVYLSWNESLNWYDDIGNLGVGTHRSEIEPNSGSGNATIVSVGQVLHGTLTNDTDNDWYGVALTAGQSILAECDSLSSGVLGPSTYPYTDVVTLRLYAPDGASALTYTAFGSSEVAAGYPPVWLFTAPATGTYYLRVRTTHGASVGYRLKTGYATRGAERGRDQRDVFVTWSDDGTAWNTPVRVSQSPVGHDDWLPEVAVAPDGQVACAWYDWRDSPAGTAGGQSNVYLALSDDAGATWSEQGSLSDARSAWSSTQSNIMPNQGDYIALIDTYEGLAACWSDGRDGNPNVYMEWIASNRPVPLHVAADTSGVDLTWFMDRTPGTTAALYRQVNDAAAPDSITTLTLDANRHLHYFDADVTLGSTYRYMLGVVTGGIERLYPPVVVRIALPAPPRLAIAGTVPSPARRDSRIVFSLAGSAPATLTLLDVTGRKVLTRPVTGTNSFSLSEAGSIRPGVYLVRIEQAGHKASKRIVLL